MNTATLSRPLPLVAPWPIRWARAVQRWLLAPRSLPHAVQIELSFHQLHDIGAPPEWHGSVAAAAQRDAIERAALRMQGV